MRQITTQEDYDLCHGRPSKGMPIFEGWFEIQPHEAEEILKTQNTHNREFKKTYYRIAEEIKDGNWIVNGAPLLYTWDGVLMDGQHRLQACVLAKKSIVVAVITNLDPSAFKTVDTGVTRSLQDVLHMEGFSYVHQYASVVKRVLALKKSKRIVVGVEHTNARAQRNHITNREGLAYANRHKEVIGKLIKDTSRIYNLQHGLRILSPVQVSIILYILAGNNYNYTSRHIEFVQRICGVASHPDQGSYWLYQRMAKAKKEKEANLSREYVMFMVVKFWNNYVNGDAQVSRGGYKYDSAEKPKPLPYPEAETKKDEKEPALM